MTVKYKFSHKLLSVFLCLTLLMSYLPLSVLTANAASDPLKSVNKTVDNPTVDGWKDIFTADSTLNAGGVWTDKSVFSSVTEYLNATDENESYTPTMNDVNNFLISLSAIASSKQITGYSTAPTDTVFVLDMSSSMRSSSYNNVEPLAVATNNAIKKLLSLNKNNRVAVVLYSGAEGQNNNDTLETRVLLPLDRYTTTDAQGDFIEYTEIRNREYILVASGVRNSTNPNQTNFGLENNRSTWSAGTFTQDGIYAATQILLDSDKVITEKGNIQEGQERMPIMVLMTDGEPSVFSTDYAGVHDDDLSDGLEHLESRHKDSTTSTGTATEFMVQLTAAYSKYLIEQHYTEHDLLFYSLGLRGNTNFATTILDPEKHISTDTYWNRYLNDSTYQNLRLTNNTVENFRITTSADIREPFVNAVKSTAEEDLRANELNKYRYYIDEYFEANSGSALDTAFDSIVDEIILQSMYYPTHVEGSNVNRGGYLTLVDTLGEYMEVKNVKNIQLGGEIFRGRNAARELTALTSTQNLTTIQSDLLESIAERLHIDKETALEVIHTAHESGMLYFKDDNDFNNAVGWYGNYTSVTEDPVYVAPWNGDDSLATYQNANCMIESYSYYGAGEDNEGSSRVADMRYIEVEVVKFLDNAGSFAGQTKVRVKIPASLIPLIVYEVMLNGDTLEADAEALTVSGAEAPIRVLYEVGLKDEINSLNVGTLAKDAYNATTDKYEFFTNKWDYIEPDKIGVTPPRDVGNSYAFFEPSAENEYLYYQFDTTVYTKQGDNYVLYTGTSKPTGTGYYGQRYVYTKPATGSTTAPTSVYYAIDAEHLKEADSVTSGGITSWILPKGTHTMADGENLPLYKTENKTGTYKTSNTAYIEHDVQGDTATYNMEMALGNNGKLTLGALQGIRLQKIVPENSGLDANAEYEFTIAPVSGTLTGSYDLYLVEAIDNDGTGGATDNGSVTASGDSLKVKIKANQTLYIAGLPVDDYTVTEAKGIAYVVSAINGSATSDNSTTVKVDKNVFTTTSFTNIARTTGNLIISKEITHPFGEDYIIPNNEHTNSFNMTVALTLNGEPLANKEYKAEQKGNSAITKVNTDQNGQFEITLAQDCQIEIFDLPENTVARVVENDIPTYFKAAYWNDGQVTTNAYGEVTVSTTDTRDILVINDYTPSSVSPAITVNGNKTLNGDAYSGDFTFKLQRAVNVSGTWQWEDKGEAQVVSYETVKGNKTFTFGDVLKGEVYTEIGDYYYRVTEVVGTDSKIIYDTGLHSFTIHVTDTDMDGKLEISSTNGITTTRGEVVSISGTTVTASFTNTHTNTNTATVTVDVEKTVNNPTGSSIGNSLAGFEFDLSQGEMGETLVTNERGALRFSLNYTADDLEEDEKTKTFTYKLKESLPDGYVNGSGAWYYDGKEVTVEVELTLNDDNTLSAVVTDNGTNATNEDNSITVGFENTYKPKATELALDFVRKELSGRDLKDGEFEFKLTAAPIVNPSAIQILDGTTPKVVDKIEGKNNANGTVTFTNALYFDKVGTYYYEITETQGALKGVTYDNTTERIVVTVTDVNGTLSASHQVISVIGDNITFQNTYIPDPISYAISGEKTLTGRALRDQEFTFVLTESDENGNPITNAKTWTARNDVTDTNTGTFTFPAIEYNAVGTNYYVVTEQKGIDGHGITYSTEKYVVAVNVTYDSTTGVFGVNSSIVKPENSTAIAFENTYIAANTAIDISGNKTLTGNRLLEANDFTFELYETESDYAYSGTPKTVKNAADGGFVFESIALTQAKTHYFMVKENIPAEKIKGVTYDESYYRIAVEVTDNGNGKLVAASPVITHINGDELPAVAIAFYNHYDADDASVTISGTKELTGRTLLDDEFTFNLYETDEYFEVNEGAVPKKAKNKADKTFAFETLTFSEEGIYYYVAEEDSSNKLERVTYDDTKYYITVTVTDDTENAKLLATYTIKTSPDSTENAESIVFENKYTPKPTDITVDVNIDKKVENKGSESITAEGFEFALKKDGDATPTTVKTDKNGKAKFTLGFTENDIGKTYNYTLTEVDTGKENVKYSIAKYDIAITVSLDNSNKLTAVATVNEKAVDNIVAEFVNEYNYTPPAPPENPPTSPKTGDNLNIHLWLALLFVSGGGIIGNFIYGRKKKEQAE